MAGPTADPPREPAAETAPSPLARASERFRALPLPAQLGIVVGAVVVFLVAVFALGSSRGPTSSGGSAEPSIMLGDRPQIPPLQVCGMLTDAEIEEAMGLLDIPWEERILIEFSGGEACSWIHERDGVDVEGLSVRIGPGAVEDFEDGADLDGLTGEPVEGIGRLAVWFGGDREGTLSVATESSLGFLFVQVAVARPDLAEEDILPVAVDLAEAALPRFPGMEAAEPVELSFDREAPDTADLGYVENLLAKEEAGEWSLGEGLVATLRYFAGEVGADEVLRDPDLVDDSGTGIIGLAREYVAGGTDAEAREEVARLLDLLVVTQEQLHPPSSAAPPTVQLASHRTPGPAGAVGRADLCEVAGLPAPCWIPWDSPAVEEMDSMFGVDDYDLHVIGNYEELGWTNEKVDWVAEAMNASAKVYETLGSVPPVEVLVTPLSGAYVLLYVEPGQCALNVNRSMQSQPEGHFKQRIAAQLAYCFFAATLPEQAPPGSEGQGWWSDALAAYFGNVVYPAPRCPARCDLEWIGLPEKLAASELQTDLFGRTNPNWLFFQHLASLIGDEGILELVRRLPAGGGDHAGALAAFPDMRQLFHAWAEDLADAVVGDTGGDVVPYEPLADPVAISPRFLILENLRPFGAVRFHLVVDQGSKACLEFGNLGQAVASWRAGSPGTLGVRGLWSEELPEELEGEAVLNGTSVGIGDQLRMFVTDVVDASDPCEEPSPAPSGCLSLICDPSGYFLQLTGLPEWFRDALD